MVRFMAILVVLFPIMAYGQEKHCDDYTYMKSAPEMTCQLQPYQILNDTFWAVVPENCTLFLYDTVSNGTWKLVASDSNSLLKIVDLENGKIVGNLIDFFENGKVRSFFNRVSRHYTKYDSIGKIEIDGYYQTLIRKNKKFDRTDTLELFIGTKIEYWDNGAMASRKVSTEDETTYEYWDTNGAVIDWKTFQKLWYPCD